MSQLSDIGSIIPAVIMIPVIAILFVLCIKDIIINIALVLGKFKFDYKIGELK